MIIVCRIFFPAPRKLRMRIWPHSAFRDRAPLLYQLWRRQPYPTRIFLRARNPWTKRSGAFALCLGWGSGPPSTSRYAR